jgi:hypothetical protein
MAQTNDHDALLGRLHVFTQDALAPLRMNNGLSFVRDFERLLGDDFFRKVKSFTSMRTDAEISKRSSLLTSNGSKSWAASISSFLGLGPEAGGASHCATSSPVRARLTTTLPD